MPSLTEALAAERGKRRAEPGSCSVCQLLARLPSEDADDLREAFAELSAIGIWRAIRAAGHQASREYVTAHKAGTCGK